MKKTEQKLVKEVYRPSLMRSYIVESDSVNGDIWFAHYDDFTNLQESNEVAFGSTPQEALQKLLELPAKSTNNSKGE